MNNLSFEIDDLDLGDLAVTSMRDSVALPEFGASSGGSCSGSSSCCCCQQDPQLPV